MMMLQIDLDKAFFKRAFGNISVNGKMLLHSGIPNVQQIIKNRFVRIGYHYHTNIDLIDDNISMLDKNISITRSTVDHDEVLLNHYIRNYEECKMRLLINQINLSFSEN